MFSSFVTFNSLVLYMSAFVALLVIFYNVFLISYILRIFSNISCIDVLLGMQCLF